MTELKLEQAALRSIFSETPAIAPGLLEQLERATVTERENTGGGFFTTFDVPDDAPRVRSRRVLGYETHAHVQGLEHGFGFVLFMEKGKLNLLEGYALAGSTASLDLAGLVFEVFKVGPGQTLPSSPFSVA
jgi:hypothetical protein